jgi:glycosyltransferase
MKISIITATFNSAATIEDTIKSVLDQTYPNIEYIIIDGGSTDGTLDIVDKYKNKIAKIVSEKDNGIFDAFNKGIKLATGDIVGILNSDDFYAYDSVIQDVVEKFSASSADTVYGDLEYVDSVDTSKVLRHWKAGEYKRSKFKAGWMPPHPTFFVKKSLYDEYGGFNTWMKISNDYELVLRLLYKNNGSAAYIPKVLIKMRSGGNSDGSLKKRYLANTEDRKAWKINGLKAPFYFAVLKPMRKLGQFMKNK